MPHEYPEPLFKDPGASRALDADSRQSDPEPDGVTDADQLLAGLDGEPPAQTIPVVAEPHSFKPEPSRYQPFAGGDEADAEPRPNQSGKPIAPDPFAAPETAAAPPSGGLDGILVAQDLAEQLAD